MAEVKKIMYKEVEERVMVRLKKETNFNNCGKVWKEKFGNKEFELCFVS